MAENDSYIARQLADANREISRLHAAEFKRDRKEALQVLADQAALATTIEQRQAQERIDIQTAEVENWRKQTWVGFHIAEAARLGVGDATAFSSSYLNPRVDASMDDPLSWAPGSAASDVGAAPVLRNENPIEHLGANETRMGRQLRELTK